MNALNSYKPIFKETPAAIVITSPDGTIVDCNKCLEEVLGYPGKNNFNSSLQSIIENKGAAVIVIDEDMTIIRVNRIFEEISGYSKTNVEKKLTFSEFIHADDQAKLIKYHYARRKKPTSVPDEYKCRILYSNSTVHSHNLKITMIPGTMKSIVSFKDTMQSVSEKNMTSGDAHMFHLLASNVTDQVFITNLAFEPMYVSPSVERVSGYTQEEFKLLKPHEYMSRESYEKAKKLLNAGLRGKYDIFQPFKSEYQFIHKNGSIIWLETIVKFIVSESGQPVGVSGASRDITERKHAEEALKQSEEQYRQLTEGLKDVVLVISPDLIIEYISPVVLEFSDQTPEEITGTHISEYFVIEKEYEIALERLMIIIAENKHSADSEFLFKAKGRRPFYIEVTANPTFKDGKVVMIQCVARDISERKKVESELKERHENLSIENINLKKSIRQSERFGNIIGKSDTMQIVYELILKAASSNANIIINGESGTGKELVARAIHDMSPRQNKPFVPVNCGAIPENIIESEFFGYKKGAFTGASSDKEGFLDLANGGTLFLDEIGEIGQNMQVKLLRAIDGGGYTPIGSNRVKKTELNIIAATNRNLAEMVKNNKMREDFFFRIHVIPVKLPPLRKRKEDIPLLIEHFLMEYRKNDPLAHVPLNIKKSFMNYHWPGNVRELQNVLSRYLTLKKIEFMEIYADEISKDQSGNEIVDESLEPDYGSLSSMVEKFEKKIIIRELDKNNWNKSRVSLILNIDRKTLSSKIKKYNLTEN